MVCHFLAVLTSWDSIETSDRAPLPTFFPLSIVHAQEMDQIEVLKKSLNTEKVFYEFNWHELAIDKSFDDPLYEQFELLKSKDSLISGRDYTNEKNESTYKDISQGGKINAENYNNNDARSEKRSKKGRQRKKRDDKICVSKYDKNGNRKNCRSDGYGDVNNENPIPSTPVHSYASETFSEKREECKIKKCDFIKEVKSEQSSRVSFIPPVDILYDSEKVIFLFFISGDLENFNISLNNNYITISGKKIPYDVQKFANYYSHEIRTGFFVRTYCFMKPIDKEKIHYEHKNGIMKIYVYTS
ncbi:conserved Plasmodium protein, unknown function [Plasmodium ovale wallikeri]|uniref:SHSP domain-containing protein n=1 Tax=Plasmodium ovale wallikeri TaxID=864142 RepID=A0A1A9A129_PLAOA|nr:conserved Plasmodium protein, unknown function [Plasmodium ovale wallikeri]